MARISEGNLYDVQDEISHDPEPTETGLETWKEEVKKQLYRSLINKNVPEIQSILKNVFGKTLD